MALMFEDCLAKAVADGRIKQRTANDFKKTYEQAKKEAEQAGKGGDDAHSFAMSEAGQRMLAQVGQKKEVIVDRILRTQRLMDTADSHTRGLFDGLMAVLGENRRGGGVEYSTGQRIAANRKFMNTMLTDFLEEIRSKNWGLTRDRAPALDLVKEAYGVDSGNASAKANWAALQKFYDWWGTSMAGEKVFIKQLKDYFLPQQFNSLKVRNLTQDGFVDAMRERWNDGRLRLRDWRAAESDAYLDPAKPEDAARVEKILSDAYDNITTNGAASIEPGMPHNTTMADRYNRRRVFEWNGYESYRDFLNAFGNGEDNLSEQFMRHLNQKAHDLGVAQVLGGDADRMSNTLIDYGRSKGVKNYKFLEAVRDTALGKTQEPANVAIANTMQGLRNIMSYAQLHSAALGSLPDFGFLHATAAFNGLDFTKIMSNYLGGMDRRQAQQLLGIIETGFRGLRDHFNEVSTANIGSPGLSKLQNGTMWEAASGGFARVTGQGAEFVMRASGLEFHSTQARAAYGMAQLARMADDARLDFAALDPRQRAFLERYGINSEHWDALRTKGTGETGLFVNPADLMAKGNALEREAGTRLMGAIDAETKMAIPEGGILTTAFLRGGGAPGWFAGELTRLLQYKGFSMSVGMLHGFRAIDTMMGKNGFMPRMQYGAMIALEATVLGAASYQLKNIANGKDPENMMTPEFWLKAAAQGGAGGMVSNWAQTLFQTHSLADATRLLPPVAGFGASLAGATTGDLAQEFEGQNTNFGRKTVNLFRQYALPRLWYTNLAIDRLMWDTLQRWADPDAEGAFRRIEQRQLNPKTGPGTQFFAPPGQGLPYRAPDLTAAAPGILR